MRLGFTELLFIFGIILIIFGPAKLPMLGQSLGEAIKNFKNSIRTEEKEPLETDRKDDTTV